jgi:hypothetical protein
MSTHTEYQPILHNNRSTPVLMACPFCGSPAVYRETFMRLTRNDLTDLDLPLALRRTEIIECSNQKCAVLPRLVRVESEDAAQLWNYRPA